MGASQAVQARCAFVLAALDGRLGSNAQRAMQAELGMIACVVIASKELPTDGILRSAIGNLKPWSCFAEKLTSDGPAELVHRWSPNRRPTGGGVLKPSSIVDTTFLAGQTQVWWSKQLLSYPAAAPRAKRGLFRKTPAAATLAGIEQPSGQEISDSRQRAFLMCHEEKSRLKMKIAQCQSALRDLETRSAQLRMPLGEEFRLSKRMRATPQASGETVTNHHEAQARRLLEGVRSTEHSMAVYNSCQNLLAEVATQKRNIITVLRWTPTMMRAAGTTLIAALKQVQVAYLGDCSTVDAQTLYHRRSSGNLGLRYLQCCYPERMWQGSYKDASDVWRALKEELGGIRSIAFIDATQLPLMDHQWTEAARMVTDFRVTFVVSIASLQDLPKMPTRMPSSESKLK